MVATELTLPDDVRRSLAAFRRLLEGTFDARLRSFVLFGSRARGDAEPDSDVDVLIVIDDLTESERGHAVDLALEARRSAGGGPVIAPLVWSSAQHEGRLSAERRIALDIATEGIAL